MAYTMTQLFHMGMFLTYTITLYKAFTMLHIPMVMAAFKNFDPGQLKYLTVWDVIELFVYFVSSIAITILGLGLISVHLKQFPGRFMAISSLEYGKYSKDTCAMREALLLGFHVITCVQFSFSVYYDYMYTVVPPNVARVYDTFGGKFKFLTFWDAIIQAVFFFICVLNDWFGTNAVSPKKPPLIRRLKDYVHAVLSFPIAMFVGVTFWSLMFLDRELVLPKALDPYFPWWLNHLMHTMIMFSTMVETVLTPKKYPKRSKGLLGHAIFMFIYLIWVHIIYYKSGVWVYPVMEVLPLPLRLVFFIVLILFSMTLYVIGEYLNNFIWGKQYTELQKSHSKSK